MYDVGLLDRFAKQSSRQWKMILNVKTSQAKTIRIINATFIESDKRMKTYVVAETIKHCSVLPTSGGIDIEITTNNYVTIVSTTY